MDTSLVQVIFKAFCRVAIQLTFEAGEDTQPIAIGIDPGKCYSGIGVQSELATLWMAAKHGVNRRAFTWIVKPYRALATRFDLYSSPGCFALTQSLTR
ncbi:MAG: hypothetical protein RID09_07210 [Coleofasciculus sp. G1-WW12-02]